MSRGPLLCPPAQFQRPPGLLPSGRPQLPLLEGASALPRLRAVAARDLRSCVRPHVKPQAQPVVSQPPSAAFRASAASGVATSPLPTSTLCVPTFALPSGLGRHLDVHPSIIYQIDALSFACRGVRIEIDLCAPDDELSFCAPYVWKSYDELASFNALLFGDPKIMPALVAVAASHRALAWFVVPVFSGQPPAIRPKPSSKKPKPVPEPWLSYLMRHSLLTFSIPKSAFSSLNQLQLPQAGFQAVLAQFGINGEVTAKASRREKHFDLRVIPGWPRSRRLGPVPLLVPFSSPLAVKDQPVSSDDTADPSTPAFVVPSSAPPLMSPPPVWKMDFVRRFTKDFPSPAVLRYSEETMTSSLQPFVGDLSRTVHQPERQMSEVTKLALRANMVKDVSKGFSDGPRPYVAVAHPRFTPFGGAPKEKYKPWDDSLRTTSDLGANDHGGPSVNDLCVNPRVIRVHFVAGFIAAMLVWSGPGVRVSLRDVKSCFRQNKLHPALLGLFVYKMVTAKHGLEYFVELAHPFGWRPSEWGWQCCLAIIEWVMFKLGLDHLFPWVDNFWQFHACADAKAHADALAVDKVFADLGLGIHEVEHVVERFKGQGWIWDVSPGQRWPMTMTCPQDKYDCYIDLLASWAMAVTLTVTQFKRAVGIMIWLAAGFRIGSAHVGPLLACLKKGKRLCKRTKKSPALVSFKVEPEVHEAFVFWSLHLRSWDRVCPVVAAFGPCFRAEVRGWVDACTGPEHLKPGEWKGGAGGVCFVPSEKRLVGFSHEWSDVEREAAKRGERQSSPYVEMDGVRLWLAQYAAVCATKRLLLVVDSDPTYLALRKCFSSDEPIKGLLRDVRELLAVSFVCLRVRSVVGDAFNKVADLLSRGQIAAAVDAAWSLFGLELVVSCQ